MLKTLAFCIGVLLVGVFANLPSIAASLLLLVLALAVWRLLRWRVSGFLLFGVVYGSLAGHHLLQQQLPLALEGQEVIVEGVVSSLPVERERSLRFEFAVARAFPTADEFSSSASIANIPATVMLSWYGADSIRVGQQWRLLVKLKRPRGFVNEGGFDYQRWLLSRGIGASGYVRDAAEKNSVNHLLDDNNFSIATLVTLRVERVRESIRLWMDAALADSKHRSLLLALAIGENSYIDAEQWRVLQATGTSHLMAISGLHVGLIAMLGFCLGHIIRVVITWLLPHLRGGYFLPSFVSVIAATAYSALAGFALPTQRALAMILVVNLAIVSARRFSIWQILTLALLAVVLLDPLAVYESGFWLSFGAVAVLALSFQNRVWMPHRSDNWVDADAQARQQHSPLGQWLIRQPRKLFLFGKAQWCVFVGLFLPLLALQLAPSMVGPFANALAIPAISFGVVVPLLAATMLAPWSNSVSVYLLQLAHSNVQTVWHYLQWLSEQQTQLPDVLPHLFANTAQSWWVMALAMIGVGFALAPRGIPGRILSTLFFLPLIIGIRWHTDESKHSDFLKLTVLDVGQGLAVVVQSRNHTLVYDTGPQYSERFNAGDAIVAQFLRAQGIKDIDTLIVSHADNDHAGGAGALLDTIKVNKMLVGESLPFEPELNQAPCRGVEPWQVDGVDYRFLYTNKHADSNNNNLSCVLVIEWRDNTVLLPGDIEKSVEYALLAAQQVPEQVDILIAPHHGSLTSSSVSFVQQAAPRWVVFSAGYNNRYNHPHQRVVQRYRDAGATLLNTAYHGQLSFIWTQDVATPQLFLGRRDSKRYWFDRTSVFTGL